MAPKPILINPLTDSNIELHLPGHAASICVIMHPINILKDGIMYFIEIKNCIKKILSRKCLSNRK